MKSLVIGFILVTGLTTPMLANAERRSTSSVSSHASIPEEISAVLLSAEYGQLLQELLQNATRSGLELRITGFDVVQLGANKFAYVFLATRQLSTHENSWSPGGYITASVKPGSQGAVLIDGLWYTPPSDLPGGVSVGSN
jgi:hypothetical protein